MGKKRWRPQTGPSAQDAIKKRKETGMTWEERKELQESLEKPKGSASLAKWEKQNTEGEVDDEIMRMNREKAMRAEAEKIRKKVEKKNKNKSNVKKR